MTAQSALARLASTFKAKLNELVEVFFSYIKWTNDRDILRGWTNPLVLIPFTEDQTEATKCLSQWGSSFCHLVLKKVRKGHLSVMFIRYPLVHFLSFDMTKNVWFLLFCGESESIMSIQCFSFCHLMCEQILLWIWPPWVSLIWHISFVCGLSLCDTFVLFSPCLSGCWELLQSVTFKKSHNRAPQEKCFCCSNHFLSHSIHYIGAVRETPSHRQCTRSKSSISAWYFCVCAYSLILSVFQGTINKN